MPWQPLPRIAFAVATYPFAASEPVDLPLELGDELYIIEETPDGNWLRGYLVAPPSLLAGLTSVKGQTLEARVFSGIFPRSCVEVREVLGEGDETDDNESDDAGPGTPDTQPGGSDSAKSGLVGGQKKRRRDRVKGPEISVPGLGENRAFRKGGSGVDQQNAAPPRLSIPVKREPGEPRPAAPVPMLKIGDETPTSASEPLIDEIASCLREWHSTNLHELLLSRQYAKLDKLASLITTLNFSRQQFLHNVLTTREYDLLREQTVWDLVRVNKLCGGEVIVRDPTERGRVLTGDDSVVEVTKLQSVMSLLDEPPTPHVETNALYHLMVDVRSFAGASSEDITLVLHVASKTAGGLLTPISESYTIEIPTGGQMGQHLSKNKQMRTLFADISPADIGDAPSPDSELFLIVKVYAPQQMTPVKPSSRSGSVSQGSGHHAKDSSKPPLSSGGKAGRRSMMWTSPRNAFSRGNPKLDALSEQPEEMPPLPATQGGQDSRDGLPPSTGNTSGSSKTPRASADRQGSLMTVERTLGVGILRLNSIMKQAEQVEHLVNIWAPSARFASERAETDNEYDSVIREILDSKSGHYEKLRRAERLHIHLRSFDSPDADALIKATPTILSGILKTNKMGFTGAPTKPRSDIYVTIDQAALTRQTLLSRYGGSATSLPSSLHGNNLEVTLEVRRSSGERIDHCIYASSNTEALSAWKSVAAERGEAWQQTVRLQVAPQDIYSSHVVLHLADAPNPPFAVAHMPLWDQQAFIQDGPHGLLLYRMDEHTATALPPQGAGGKGGYLSLPFCVKSEHQAEVTGPLAILRVATYLCSTKFSQDRIVLGLLKWKEYPKDEIPTLLKQLVFVAEIEVVKLLNDVLDSLFGILVEYSGNDDYEDLVFTALVRVLDIVHDRRFNLAPLVDQYAENKFNYPFATPCLVRSFTRLLSRPTEPETARKLRATFKVVRHILKFITHARDQQKVKEADIGITGSASGFTRHLRTIFKALDAMMRSTAPVLVGSQTLAVQHFHTWLPELSGMLTTEEILHIAIDFMDSCALVKGKLVLYKLVLIINYSKLDIFAAPEQRSALSANTVRWIAPHWGRTDEVTEQWRDQVRLCCSVLASQVDHLGPEIPDHIPNIVESYLALQALEQKPQNRLSLLFPATYPFPHRPLAEDVPFDEALIELSAVLSALSNSPSGMQFDAEDELEGIIANVLRMHMSILQGEAFPTSWLSVHIFHHKSTMRTLQYIASILLETFLPHPDDAREFSTELWKMFFTTLLKLVGSSSLALETFPEQKRRAVWKIAGDVREHGAELLRRTWEAIGWETSVEERGRYGLTKMGGYQVQYVPTLVGPIVELCLSVHEGLRRMAVEVLQTMIVSEWTLSEDLSVIQTEMIDCLDRYFKSKPLTESLLQKLFVGELLERFHPLSLIPDDLLYQAITEFMATINEFLDLLVAVHSADGDGEASHMIHRLRLMDFLRDMQKEEIFIRYVHSLAKLQAESRNHAEAGLALRLHADLYDWDPIKTTPALHDPKFPAQSCFERKERIYFDMIKHFEDGEAWGSALEAYKELQAQYEDNVFDFAKLARTERAIATVYETIAKSDRLVPKYFRVTYKGHGFPSTLRDKEFVYEGAPGERTSAFTDRMQEQYPSAQIVTSDNIDDVEGQFLVISALTPHRDLDHQVFQRARVPQAIRDYLVSRHPQRFSTSTKRSTIGPVSEHYAEKTVYTTAEPFPTILRRSEIVAVDEIRLSAKETALERIVRKTAEMTAVEKKLAEGGEGANSETVQLLLDAVSISVNPNSESSVVCYRELLPSDPSPKRRGDGSVEDEEEREDDVEDDDEYDEDEDEEHEPIELDAQENAIKMALIDHAIMLKRCLATFAKSNSEMLRSRVDDLQRYFEGTFAPEIAAFMPAQPSARDAHTTPPPTWPRSPQSVSLSPQLQQGQSLGAALANGTGGDEVSIVKPVSLRQGRGARLSFLSVRKKDGSRPADSPLSPPINGNGNVNGDSNHLQVRSDDEFGGANRRSRSLNKENPNRRSFFRSHSSDNRPPAHLNGGGGGGTDMSGAASGMDWVTDSGGTARESSDISTSLDKGGNNAMLAAGGEANGHYHRDGNNNQNGNGNGPVMRVGSVKKRFSMLKLGKKSSRGNGLMSSLDEE